jgi:hypothetical protein
VARRLSPRQEEALTLIEVRIAEYAERFGTGVPNVRFRPDQFDGRVNAHYEPYGIKNVRPDATITFFNVEFAYDAARREQVVAHEFLHHLEHVTDSTTHVTYRRNRRGRLTAIGASQGRHSPAFYAKLDRLIADMATHRPA